MGARVGNKNGVGSNICSKCGKTCRGDMCGRCRTPQANIRVTPALEFIREETELTYTQLVRAAAELFVDVWEKNPDLCRRYIDRVVVADA